MSTTLRDSAAAGNTGASSAATEINCFGCAPANPVGLRLVFEDQAIGLAARIRLGRDYESFPGIVHGGIVATILDEILAQAICRSGRGSAITAALRIRYGRPMHIDAEHHAYAEITRTEAGSVRVSGRIELPNGDLVAAADGTFVLLTDDILDQNDHLSARLPQALRESNRTT